MAAETCWALSDGKAGNENPCLGLAEAVGLSTTVKRVRPRAPWSYLPPQLWFAPFSAPGPDSDPLAPPWPDLLIAAGRQSVALSIAIKRASDGRCFTVQLLDPRVDPANFDLVVAPKHDRLEGANVIVTRGALNRITPERLADAAREFEVTVAALPSPRVAVLIGGASKHHRMSAAEAAAIGERLASFARASGAGLMVTTSRRTGADNTAVLQAKLGDVGALIWDGAGANPYFGYLAHAEAIIVTSDSGGHDIRGLRHRQAGLRHRTARWIGQVGAVFTTRSPRPAARARSPMPSPPVAWRAGDIRRSARPRASRARCAGDSASVEAGASHGAPKRWRPDDEAR